MRRVWIAIIFLGLATIACDLGSGPNQVAVVTATVVQPSETPIQLPPSWTPGPAPTSTATVVRTPSPVATIEGASTLPPTWTPASVATVTKPPLIIQQTIPPTLNLPTVTPVVRATSTGPAKAPTPAPDATYAGVCETFQIVAADTSIRSHIKIPAKVAWTKVDGAEGYRVWVIHPDGRIMVDEKLSSSTLTYTISGDVFNAPGGYGWEVMPVQNGDRMCGSRTGVIVIVN